MMTTAKLVNTFIKLGQKILCGLNNQEGFKCGLHLLDSAYAFCQQPR